MGLGETNVEKHNEYTELLINENIIDVAISETQTIILIIIMKYIILDIMERIITIHQITLPFMNLLNPNNDSFN